MSGALDDFADMGDVVDEFSEPFLIVRRAAGTYDLNGRFVEANDSEDIDAMGSVTPVSPNDLQRLPEGRRTDKSMRLITATPLIMEPQADVIEWNGEEWEVSSVGPWVAFGYVDAIITKRVAS